VLAQGYTGRRGSPLTQSDVDGLVDRHKLREILEKKERELVLSTVADQHGALGRCAHILGMSSDDLEKIIKSLRLRREVDLLRERAIREALASRNLPLRLEWLGRGKYLDDLGIRERFVDSLTRDLEQLRLENEAETESLGDLLGSVAQQYEVPPDVLRGAIETLGLLEAWTMNER
jgi:hypothetical protein